MLTLFVYQSLRISSNSSCRWFGDPEGMRKDIRAVNLNKNNTFRLRLPDHSCKKYLTAHNSNQETPNLKKVEKYGGRKYKIKGIMFKDKSGLLVIF